MASLVLRAEIQKGLTAAQIAAAAPNYTPVLVDPSGAATTGSFQNPIRLMVVRNLTDADLQFSFDGVNDHFVIPSQGFELLDIMANHLPADRGWWVEKFTTINVKEIGSPTTGQVYVSGYYASGGG